MKIVMTLTTAQAMENQVAIVSIWEHLPFDSFVGERFGVFDDVGELASGDLTDTDKLVEVERPAIEFAVETVAWNACLYSDLILREPSVFYGALEDITNLSRCHIFNLLQTEPPKFYLRLICVI